VSDAPITPCPICGTKSSENYLGRQLCWECVKDDDPPTQTPPSQPPGRQGTRDKELGTRERSRTEGGEVEVEGKEASGEVDELGAVEWLLAEFDAGRIEPVPVRLSLPASASQPMMLTAEFFARVYGLRLWAGDRRPVLFTHRWVARKLGLPRLMVYDALKQLVADGVLVDGGKMPGSRSQLYAPSPARDALPPGSVPVEADVAADGLVDQRQEGREDVAVSDAVADDGGEVRERDDGLGAAGNRAGAAGGVHGVS
jgi:hypothetical protein